MTDSAPPAADHAPLRLLLVEDSPADAELLLAALARAGLKVEARRVQTEDALRAALAEAAWDVVVTDHNLPGFSAEGALRVTQASGRDVPVLVVSGHLGEERAVDLMRAGATDYVSKNNLTRLAPAIEREVRDARIRHAQRAAEAQLRFQARLLDEVSQAVIVTDAAGCVSYMNRFAEQLYGWPAAEAHGRPVTDVTTAADNLDRAGEILARLMQGESWQGEFEVTRRDGARFPAFITNAPIFDEAGQLVGIIGVSADITMIKQRERHLAALAQVATALRQASSRETIITTVLAQAAELLAATGAALLLRPAPGGPLRLAQVQGRCERPDAAAWEAAAAALEAVLSQAAALLVSEAATAPPGLRPLLSAGCAALLAVPLVTQDLNLGALVLGLRQPALASETALLAAIADMAAAAIHRATLFEEISRRAEEWAAVSALGQALGETLDAPRLYGLLRDAVRRLLPDVTAVSMARYDARQNQLTTVLGGDGRAAPALAAGESAIHQRQPIIGAGWLAVPLLAKGQGLGVLVVERPAPFTAADADLLTLAASTAAVALNNADLFAEASRRLDHLQALHDIDIAISASLDVSVTLSVFLAHVTQQLRVDAADVLLLSPATQALEYAAGRGFRRGDPRQRLRLGQGYAGRAALERRFLIRDPRESASGDPRAALMAAEQFAAHVVMPLVAKGEVRGVVEVFHRSPLDPTPEWLDFLETLTGQAAIAVDQAAMFGLLQQSNAELSVAYEATIEGWSRALDLRDKETEGHTQRVTELSLRLALQLGLPSEDLVHMRRGALLHDIGKMGIPDYILLKPGPLSDAEWVIMRRHPVYAYEMLLPIAYLRPALAIPYCHHEKWDGTGYPRGLAGEAIPLPARIFAVVDVWDALRSDRPYRAAWPAERVRAHILALSGAHFDPAVVEAFMRLEV